MVGVKGLNSSIVS